MVLFKLLLVNLLYCVTIQVHCGDNKGETGFNWESPFLRFERKLNEHGFWVPKLRTEDERVRGSILPLIKSVSKAESAFHQTTVKLEPTYVEFLGEPDYFKKYPVLQYIGLIGPSEPLQSIEHFRLFELTEPRPDTNGEMKKYYVLSLQRGKTDHHYDTPAYFAPQHGFVDIPLHPKSNEPKYLFTQFFSGCSLVVDRFDDHLRVYHVNGGQENEQYNNIKDHGKGMAASLEYYTYGYHDEYQSAPRRRIENTFAMAYMEYSDGAWKIHHQRLDGTGGTPMIHKLMGEGTKWQAEVSIPKSLQVLRTGELSIGTKSPKDKMQDVMLEYLYWAGKEKACL